MFDTYNNLIEEWRNNNIIEEVSNDNDNGHYISYRAVYRPTSVSTPIQPVYDASCKVENNKSLNKCLYRGRIVTCWNHLPALLNQFRENNIAFIAYINCAFLMIKVTENDRDFQRFLWWRDADKHDISVLRHQHVMFGLTCSPYILNAVIQYPFQ